jgi:hypothetical protein
MDKMHIMRAHWSCSLPGQKWRYPQGSLDTNQEDEIRFEMLKKIFLCEALNVLENFK